jgi:hypothetical protein
MNDRLSRAAAKFSSNDWAKKRLKNSSKN